MKLRTRLTAAVVAVSSAGTLLIGGVSISDVRSSKLEAVDQTLFAVTGQADATKSDQVGAALFAADQSSIAVAVGFAAKGSGFTWLRDLPEGAVPVPGPRLREAALTTPQSAFGYRMVSVRLKNGEFVVVAASVKDIDRQTTSDIVSLATFWLVLVLFMGLLIRILVRRDVAQIERLVVAAARIAEGAESVDIPDQASSAEVTTLAQALRRTVASLRATLEFEQATTQRMQQFLGDASHELRTPLTVIRGYLELLERDVPPEQRERALLRMRSEAQRMEALVNDLLLLAEIGTPLPEVFEVLDLTALVRVFVDDLRELQPQRPVTSSVETPVLVRAIPSHLHHGIGNAFANIRRHTGPADAVHVSLSSDGTWARLVIEDGGPGLSPKMYERGISHFQRFDQSRSRASGGSGLGMSIIAAVMAETGGSVELSPSELGGLRMQYRFPLAPR